jgi:hypothetical protein
VNTGDLKPQADWVGTYTLENGSKIPAVFVAGALQVPSAYGVEGIECVIQDVPEVEPIATTINGVIQKETWVVRFTNYGSKKGTVFPLTLRDISYLMGRLYSSARQSYQSRTSVTYESLLCRVLIHDLQPSLP